MSGAISVKQSINGNINSMGIVSGNINLQNYVSGNITDNRNVSGEIARPETIYVSELRFSTHYAFPAVGNSKNLYIATDENAIYRFDDETNTYFCVGRDYNKIEAIQITLIE